MFCTILKVPLTENDSPMVAGNSLTTKGNRWWMVIGDNKNNLIFLQEKIFPFHENIIILCIRCEYFG